MKLQLEVTTFRVTVFLVKKPVCHPPIVRFLLNIKKFFNNLFRKPPFILLPQTCY